MLLLILWPVIPITFANISASSYFAHCFTSLFVSASFTSILFNHSPLYLCRLTTSVLQALPTSPCSTEDAQQLICLGTVPSTLLWTVPVLDHLFNQAPAWLGKHVQARDGCVHTNQPNWTLGSSVLGSGHGPIMSSDILQIWGKTEIFMIDNLITPCWHLWFNRRPVRILISLKSAGLVFQ